MANKNSIDGFIHRRPVGGAQNKNGQITGGLSKSSSSKVSPFKQDDSKPIGVVRPEYGNSKKDQIGALKRSDIDESLKKIDSLSSKSSRRRQPKPQKGKVRRIIKRVILLLILLGAGAGVWLGIKVVTTSDSIFKGNIFGLIQEKELKQDENGRTNILVLGTSEDDPGHDGAFLTDSIMVVSINQKANDAYMISIPRDLPVKYGMACNSGYSGKINEYFNCVNGDWDSEAAEEERQTETRAFIGDILGLDIQYSAHVNYTVMRDLVAAVGTITVDIEGSGGAPGVMDSNFDWKCKGGDEYASLATMKQNCPPNGHFIDYPNGPAQLDAEHALYLAQARGDLMPTYGLGNSNFDREQNQQKIMIAIRDKALSTGTLTNIGKVTSLLDALGNNLRTNFDTSEIRTLARLAKDINESSIVRLNLLKDGIMTGDAVPVDGMFNFAGLQKYIHDKLSSDPVVREAAKVVVLNASGVSGSAGQEANKLSDLGMDVGLVDNAPESFSAGKNYIFKVSTNDKPATLQKLKAMYGVDNVSADISSLNGSIDLDGYDYVVIVGVASTDR